MAAVMNFNTKVSMEVFRSCVAHGNRSPTPSDYAHAVCLSFHFAFIPQTSRALRWCAPRSRTQPHTLVCRAEKIDKVETARKLQTTATDLLAQLMKAENTEQFARENVEYLNQEFFMIASTYLSMAKKEGNAEVVSRIETTLKIAMQEREKTLRPEIQLLNQLLRDDGSSERSKTMNKFLDYLKSDSYFFQLLNRMTLDVEKQPTSRRDPEQMKLLAQLRAINKEAREVSKNLKHAVKE